MSSLPPPPSHRATCSSSRPTAATALLFATLLVPIPVIIPLPVPLAVAAPLTGGSAPAGPIIVLGDGMYAVADPRPFTLAAAGQTCIAAWEFRGSPFWMLWPAGPLGNDDDILSVRSADGGITWSAASPLNSNAATDSTSDNSVSLAADGAGVWIAVWDRQGSGAAVLAEIMLARSADDGVTWSAPLPLQPTPTSADDFLPRIAHAGGSNWLAAWGTNDTLGGTIGTDADIVVSRSSDHGVTWSAPVAVAADAATDTAGEGPCAIACSPSGLAVVAWPTLNGPDGAVDPERDIRVAVSQDFGASWSSHALLSELPDDPLRDEIEVDVVIDALDRAHVIWRLRSIGGVSLDGPLESLQSVRSDDGGATWSVPIDVASAPREGAALRSPRLIASGTALHACWAAVGRDGPMGPEVDADIVVASSTDGGSSWGAARAAIPGSVGEVSGDFTPVVAPVDPVDSLESGAAILVWRRESGPDAPVRPRILAQRLDLAAPPAIGADCDQDGAADAEEIAAGWLADCDGDGVPDRCQIAAAPELDCDEDGVLDACAIASGAVADCDGDGVPDSCQLTTVPAPGTAMIESGYWFPGTGSDFVLLRGCRVRAGLELIDALAVEFQPTTSAATLLVMSDPNQDGNPGDAILLAAVPVMSTDLPTIYDIPPTVVGAAGDWYFVGMMVQGVPGGFLGHIDATTTSGRAWTVRASAGQIDLDDLAGSANIVSVDGQLGVPFTFAVTPLGPSPFDARGDGTIDACVVTGDLDGDGAVTGADLGLLLAAWGACAECTACPADLDGDCEVGGADMGLLLAGWAG